MSEKTIFRFGLFVLGTIVLALTYYYANINTPNLPNDTSPTVTTTDEQKKENNDLGNITENFEQAFIRDGLKTNTSIRSIDLKLVLGGGPGKDGIPSIDNPTFTSIANADSTITDDTLGLVVEAEGTTKFYPYNILVWHEIVNDVVGKTPLVVTFCPLCGSAIVFDATYDGEAHDFGVSGKLYDSNLLMYDRKTESLWSQIIGEAVVGDETGKKLEIYPSQIITLAQLKASHPTAQILSTNTGSSRDYRFYPYGDYDNNESLYFPISIKDTRLPAKTIMHIVNIPPMAGIPSEGGTNTNESVAFDRGKLVEAGKATATLANGTQVLASVADGEITVIYANDRSGQKIPGYTAMWFSWAAHHQEDGVVWSG